MIKPTVGRVVLYHPAPGSTIPCGLVPEEGLTLAALVAVVHDEETITIGAFDRNGDNFGVRRVPLIQEGFGVPWFPYCEWMPYQKGQAAKTEELEQTVRLGQHSPTLGLVEAKRQEPARTIMTGSKVDEAQPAAEVVQELSSGDASSPAPAQAQ